LASSSNNKTSRQQTHQMTNKRYNRIKCQEEARVIQAQPRKDIHYNFTLIQTARPQDYASGLSESHPHALQKGQS